MDESPGFGDLRSTGRWLACSTCGEFIDRGNWNALLNRAVDKLRDKYNEIPRRILTDTIKRSHELFREHYKAKT